MPVPVSYPGVYVEEVPSGVRTITGVATSITAFIGWAARGPVDKAVQVLSWSDYYRRFGGLDPKAYLGHAVSQFFANGGQRAYIVRLARLPAAGAAPGANDAIASTVPLAPLDITASNPGRWADDYRVTIKNRPGEPRFRLQVLVHDARTNQDVIVESFENLSMDETDPNGRYVVHVLQQLSQFVRASLTAGTPPSPPPAPPPDTAAPAALGGGRDGDFLDVNTAAFHTALRPDLQTPPSETSGLPLLDKVDLFNLLCIPGETDPATLATLEAYCRDHRAFLIADCEATADFDGVSPGPNPVLLTASSTNAAFYFPWVKAPDPLKEGRARDFPPSGFVAGLYAKIDATRGVWKAPAGVDASLTGVLGVTYKLTDQQNGVLNPQAINCLREFDVYGTVIWGARTLRGNDEIGSEWKYIPVRRTALFIEESLYRALKWVVFEPNDEPLWGQIRLNVGAFMRDLFRQGAFQGTTPRDAYFVKCDRETTTQNDINRGIVNILVGFAPLKPAEFVIIQLQQIAGQIQV